METKMECLAKKKLKFLRAPQSFSADYSCVLKHKIKSKVKALNDELELLQRAGLIEFSKIIEISKICPRNEKLENRSFSQKSNSLLVGLPVPITKRVQNLIQIRKENLI
jgi:hypothetical protein